MPEGSITGLVGPHGAGKSTLLRLAAALSRPTTGTVSIFGEQVEPNSTRHLYAGLRVGETLRFGQKFNQQWDDDAALRLLNELEVPLAERVGRLSLGQQALVALSLCIGKREPDLEEIVLAYLSSRPGYQMVESPRCVARSDGVVSAAVVGLGTVPRFAGSLALCGTL